MNVDDLSVSSNTLQSLAFQVNVDLKDRGTVLKLSETLEQTKSSGRDLGDAAENNTASGSQL